MATNRIETLDPALIRPGRIDRKIEFPLPDEKTKRRIFSIHTSRMTLAPDVNLAELIMAKDDLSGADIKVIFTFNSNIILITIVFCLTNLINLLHFSGDLYRGWPNGLTRASDESYKRRFQEVKRKRTLSEKRGFSRRVIFISLYCRVFIRLRRN